MLCSRQEKQKGQVVEALTKKGAALCDLFLARAEGSGDGRPQVSSTEGSPEAEPPSLADLNRAYAELLKWADPGDTKVRRARSTARTSVPRPTGAACPRRGSERTAR